MAAEKPSILGINSAIKEIIKKSNGGLLVKPGNVKFLKEAIYFIF